MYLGIDLGTSGIKVVLVGEAGQIIDSHTSPLTVSRPQPLWSEQDPEQWWKGFCLAMDTLSSRNSLNDIKAIGLSGQMHGATLLDSNNKILRPAILWNDGRSELQCQELETLVTDSRQITGNIIMAGFTAPKLLWVKQHEPEIFSQISKVLLPKDYLRLRITGEFATDLSDAAGTLWLDVGKRSWSKPLLAACGLDESHMPVLFEGNQITGAIIGELADRWNMPAVPVIAGGGDNAAGAVGVGIVNPGQAMLSLGTSGVYFTVTDGFRSNPDSAVHAFCHALPGRWHLMSVLLSAASCLQWYADNLAHKSVATLLEELEESEFSIENTPLFLPYLSGERTPHNDPHAKGVWFGLDNQTKQAMLTHSVLEGVSLAFADAVDALHQSGVESEAITLIGGGAKSRYWRQMLADVLQRPMRFCKGGEVGPALGAARLAQLAVNPTASVESICPEPELLEVHQPDLSMSAIYRTRREKFKQLYQQLSPLF